jgi:hypothetical protein
VALRAGRDRGTAPVAARVKAGEVTTLTLQPRKLDAEIRVEPTPINAVVALDGVEIGRGIWDGRLPSGDHLVEVAAEGFLPSKRTLGLDPGARELLRVELERDPDSPLWAEKRPSRVVLHVHAAPVLAPLFAGELADDCSGSCTGGIGLGALATIRGGYQFGVGIQLTLDAGFLWIQQSIEGRAGSLTPRGLAPNAGALSDRLRLLGVLAGGSAGYQTGGDWPFLIRAGGGVLFASVRDERSGTFQSNLAGSSYDVGGVSESPSALYAYVGPELGLGRRLGEHVTLRLFAQGLFLFAIQRPQWTDENVVLAGPCDGLGPCEGEAAFGEQPVAAQTIIAVTPGLGIELAF